MILILSILLLQCGVFSQEITTKAGTFRGVTKKVSFRGTERSYSEYLGIPYGESPMGERRFKKPIAKAPLDEPFEATYLRPACPQTDFPEWPLPEKDEDCLRLNIFVPEDVQNAEKLPVMIWVHGGGFVMGSGHIYNASALSTFGEVIVVVINYRLSIFGFLATGDEASPGNYGLWDQHLAIKWVSENIEAFGGDTQKVTLFGESAGGASVVYQAMFPGNKGLFQRVIAESGSSAAPWAFNGAPNATLFFDFVGCQKERTEDIVSCLRGIDMDTLVEALNNPNSSHAIANFVPSMDNEFLRRKPIELINDPTSEEMKHFKDLDFLSGVNDLEGAVFMTAFWPMLFNITDTDTWNVSRDVYENQILPFILAQSFPGVEIPRAVKDAYVFQYTDWRDPDNYKSKRDYLMQLSGDFPFVIPSAQTLEAHVAAGGSGKQFAYEFAVHVDFGESLFAVPKWTKGANHGVEISFVFGHGINSNYSSTNINWTSAQVDVSETMMTYWTNFAKTGNPNAPNELAVEWPVYTREKMEYVKFQDEVTQALSRFGEPRTTFWLQLVPSLMKCQKEKEKETITQSKKSEKTEL